MLIDGDRQNDPGRHPAPARASGATGYDLVAGWRVERQDPWLTRRLPSQLANWLIGAITGVRLHDYGCTLKLIRGDLARSLRLYGEMHRFIPALVDDLGGRDRRAAGASPAARRRACRSTGCRARCACCSTW